MERMKMLLPGYDVAKAAQVVAYFALKSGGKINVLKLAKLLYLADREFMIRYDEPMLYDRLVSMPDGPVTSITNNFIDGRLEARIWQTFVSPRRGYDVSAAGDIDFEALDELSRAEVEVLEHLWSKFGSYDKYAIRDWTHNKANVPEWEDPKGSSYDISYEKIFRLLGKPDAKALNQQIDERRKLFKVLSNHA